MLSELSKVREELRIIRHNQNKANSEGIQLDLCDVPKLALQNIEEVKAFESWISQDTVNYEYMVNKIPFTFWLHRIIYN